MVLATMGMVVNTSAQTLADSSSLYTDTLSPITIQKITITGNRRTKEYIVGREVALKEGAEYTPETLAKAIQLTHEQLMNTTLFVDVKVDTALLPGNQAELRVAVKERWYIFPSPYFRVIDRNWNVWLKDYGASLERANIGMKLMHENFSGRNDKFNLWLIGGYTQQISFNYFKPYFDKRLRFGYNLGFIYARNREMNFVTESNRQQFLRTPFFLRKYIHTEAGLSYRKGSNLRMQLRGSYNFEGLADTVVKRNPAYLGGGKTSASYFDALYQVQFYNVDYIPYPQRGWYIDANALGRIGGKGSLNMLQMGMRFSYTKKILPAIWMNLHAAGILRLPNNQPYLNTRLLGYGDVYMQGLEYFVVDGTAGGFLRGTVRTQLFQFAINNLFNVKRPESKALVRRTFNGLAKTHNHIPFRVFLKVFGNLGYVHNSQPGNSYMNNRLLRTGGIGLDIVTIYDRVLKLELSFNQFDRGGYNNLGNKLFVHSQSDF